MKKKNPNFRDYDTFFPNLPGFGPVPKTMRKNTESFENTVGKREIAQNEPLGKFSAIFIKFKIVICKLFKFKESKIRRLGKG